MSLAFLLWCVLAFLVTALAAVIAGQRWNAAVPVYCVTALISLSACACAVTALLTHQSAALQLPLGLPWIGANFRLDVLSALFLAIVNLGGAGASIFGLGYGRQEAFPGRILPFFCIFLAAMNLVVLCDDAFTFLLSWELMSLASWALVMAHHDKPENVHAGLIYILMASFGTFVLLLAFGLLAGSSGQYSFEAIRLHQPMSLVAGMVFLLALVGAGSKAGLVPLHVWLPLAHPAAPSHVSALMSGIMTKVAIYAFIRIALDLLGPPVWWWGMVLLAAGGASALMGVLYGLFQTDIKRVLAYSTIENVGIIFIGLGLALSFRADHFETAAILALTAALFHVINHSLFKSLLFFCSGAILSATHERNLEHLGGLIHRMPVTALACLAGCLAISGLPPFNGFVSEWLTFQAILLSPELPQWGLKLGVPAVGALLALSVALAGACFVHLFGIAFLGRPRTSAAATAHETGAVSPGVLLTYAVLCLLIGVVPGLLIDALGPVSQSLFHGTMPVQATLPWLSLVPISATRSSYNGLVLLLMIVAVMASTVVAIAVLASRSTRRAPAWDCGFPSASTLTQYTAGSFSQPIRRVFGTVLFRARENIEIPPPGNSRPARMTVRLQDVIWDVCYAPLSGAVTYLADRLNGLQFLTIRRYLSLVFATLVILLLVVAIWR
jgi:formate hydrogenlyase subunit 3/multisubunit Na+/H+ antiporter MnhD subunit